MTFDIEPVDDGRVKLTVIHTGFPPESIVRELVSGGWPSKLSDLKSNLELEPAPVNRRLASSAERVGGRLDGDDDGGLLPGDSSDHRLSNVPGPTDAALWTVFK